MLRLFLDSADIDEIRTVYSLITLDGVTTNPSILAESRNKYGSPVLALKVISRFVSDHGGTLHVQEREGLARRRDPPLLSGGRAQWNADLRW